jgi:hypothetical protein
MLIIIIIRKERSYDRVIVKGEKADPGSIRNQWDPMGSGGIQWDPKNWCSKMGNRRLNIIVRTGNERQRLIPKKFRRFLARKRELDF